MADGFKKYFNGNTMSGRANVAKATYATIALVYLFYRVRRGKAQPPSGEIEPIESSSQSQCACDEKSPEPSNDGRDQECAICRDRSSGGQNRREGCNGHDGPPPPSAPKATEATRPRRKCPCEDPHRHVDAAMQAPEEQVQTNVNQLDEAHPARELMAQMQEAASRALRNVIGAVIGDTSPNPNFGSESGNNTAEDIDSDGDCSCCIAASAGAGAAVEQTEDDGSDYGDVNQLRQRRASPSNTNGSSDIPDQMELQHEQSQEQSQTHSRFRCFDDDFASEMFFESYDE